LKPTYGSAITYDSIGNPLSYKGFNMGWSGGRQLSTISGNGVTSGSFKYDSNGQRTEKKISGVTTDYYYTGGQLLAENRGGTTYYYQYDAAGRPAKIFYVSSSGTATAYYLVSNSRGDIEEIWSGSGNLTARYFYDAFGNVTSIKNAAGAEITSATNIALINPFRYRGYYYDSETGLYYLGSRYYDPATGRFINADGMVDTAQDMHGANMFSYCGNDPVDRSDASGQLYYGTEKDSWYYSGNPNAKDAKILKPIYDKAKLKSNPAPVKRTPDNSGYAKESDASVIARMLYGEDPNSMAAHLWIVENRRTEGGYRGGPTFRGLILGPGQFSCMDSDKNFRALDPGFYVSDPAEKRNWDSAVDMAYQYTENGFKNIPYPKEFKEAYTWTQAYSDDFKASHPNGNHIGGTWFYNK